jgi:hypothetical protein
MICHLPSRFSQVSVQVRQCATGLPPLSFCVAVSLPIDHGHIVAVAGSEETDSGVKQPAICLGLALVGVPRQYVGLAVAVKSTVQPSKSWSYRAASITANRPFHSNFDCFRFGSHPAHPSVIER